MKNLKTIITGLVIVICLAGVYSFESQDENKETAVVHIVNGTGKDARIVISKGLNDVKTVTMVATMPKSWEENNQIIAGVFADLAEEGYKVKAGGNERFVLQK